MDSSNYLMDLLVMETQYLRLNFSIILLEFNFMSYYLKVVIKLQTKGVIYTFPVLGSPLLFVLPLGKGGLTIET